MTTIVHETKNYNKIELLSFNRDVRKTKALEKSMLKHGWIDAYPMHVVENGNGKLKIKGGHHRFYVAQKLGIAVKYVISDDNADIYELEQSNNKWTINDYLASFVRNGSKPYIAVRDYSEKTGIPISNSLSLLGGEGAGSGNKREAFKTGKYKLGDQVHANKVADVIMFLTEIGLQFSTHGIFIQAISKVLLVSKVNIQTLKNKFSTHMAYAEKQPSLINYLQMIELIYNRQGAANKKIPLAFLATEASKKRSVANLLNRK